MKLALSLALAVVFFLGCAAPPSAQGPLRVALLPDAPELARRLALDPRTHLGPAADAQVVWLLADRAAPADIEAAVSARRRGAGLVIALADPSDPVQLPAFGLSFPAPVHKTADLAPGRGAARLGDVLVRAAPKIAGRVALPSGGEPLIDVAHEGPALLLREDGPAPLILCGLALLAQDNAPLRRWGYGNYLLHALTALAARAPATPFADWPAAPVPHGTARTLWIVGLCLLWPLTLAAFALARRATRRAGPHAGRDFLAEIDRAAAQQAASPEDAGQAALWAHRGFHRPLAGFLVMVCTLCVFIAPYVGLVQYVLPTYVQNFPEVEGMWSSVYEVTYWVWVFFDMGTSLAFVKYFAELRRKDPEEALAMVQFFNWWQIFTGAIQVTILSLLALFVLPRTPYALYAHLLAIYGLSQWPGIFQSFYYFFQAAQRYDYFQIVDMLQNRLLTVAGPVPVIMLGRYLGGRSPIFGEALGTVLGLAAGAYVGGLLVLVISLGFYRKMGARIRPLFLAGFNRATALRVLRYGFAATLGNLPHKLANAVEILILAASLLSRDHALGIRGLIWYKFYFLFTFLNGWTQPAVATFSEAHGAGRMVLLRYSIARYFQYGHLFCAMIFAFLVALGPSLITRALDPAWADAAPLLPLACVVGLLLPAAWVFDAVLQGCGRPGLSSALMFVEQAVRLGLFFLLVPRLQLAGIFVALLLTLALKMVLGIFLIQRSVTRLTVPAFAAILLPHLCGALAYLLFRGSLGAVDLVAGGHAGTFALVTLTIACAVALFPVGFFLLGLSGALDPEALRELSRGARLASGFHTVAALLQRGAALGARLCPFGARLAFPADFVAAASAEADADGALPTR